MSDETFKRVEYHYRGPLQLSSHPLPSLTKSLKPTEIIVKLKAASLNPVDLLLYHTHSYLFFKRNTKGIGRDFSGVVSHAGSKVDAAKFKVGDKVSGIFEPIFTEQGTLTEYLKLDIEHNPNFGKFPIQLSFEEASSFPLVFGTAYTLFTHHKKPTKDSNVLVIGGGTSVGWYTLQLLKNYYNVDFVASINSGKSTERVQSLGVDKIVDYTKGDVAKQVLDLVEANGGKKFDLILDTVGSKDIFPIIHDVLKPKAEDSGYVTIVGDHVADYHGSALGLASFSFIYKLFVSQSYHYKVSGIVPGGWYELAVELFEQGKLKTLIDSTYPFGDYQEAFKQLIDHKAQGKVVLKIDE